VPGDNAQHDLFVVPAGQRIVVRYITLAAADATGVLFLMYLYPGGAEVFRADTSQASKGLRFDTRIVFHEGETCRGRTTGPALIVHASGYELAGGGGPMVPATLPA
jgi:hypothetical protein